MQQDHKKDLLVKRKRGSICAARYSCSEHTRTRPMFTASQNGPKGMTKHPSFSLQPLLSAFVEPSGAMEVLG